MTICLKLSSFIGRRGLVAGCRTFVLFRDDLQLDLNEPGSSPQSAGGAAQEAGGEEQPRAHKQSEHAGCLIAEGLQEENEPLCTTCFLKRRRQKANVASAPFSHTEILKLSIKQVQIASELQRRLEREGGREGGIEAGREGGRTRHLTNSSATWRRRLW